MSTERFRIFNSILSTRYSALLLVNLFARISVHYGIVRPICFATFNLDHQFVAASLYLTEPGPVYRL
jgi:hypothetical protein